MEHLYEINIKLASLLPIFLKCMGTSERDGKEENETMRARWDVHTHKIETPTLTQDTVHLLIITTYKYFN